MQIPDPTRYRPFPSAQRRVFCDILGEGFDAVIQYRPSSPITSIPVKSNNQHTGWLAAVNIRVKG